MKRDLDLDLVLDVRDVHKHFTLHLRGGLQLPVLRGVSLQVAGGECVALVGPSGRGKSTLMKCLYGSYAVNAGALWLRRGDGEGLDLASASPQTWVAMRRREIAYVSQFLRALPRQAALDVVAERRLQAHPAEVIEGADPLDDGPYLAALDTARDAARLLLARLNLPESLWGLPPATFSGGEQQRVNIARGFVEPARLLLLDEPTASLDAGNRRIVIDLIREAKAAGAAVVGIFHDEEVRDAVADRCVHFD
ncbi:phosphonate C-P lyase system protein PhnL [Roseateles paludis]|jgi:alpha-D-ribose 1-methylphosphonate 5-triphosphate synthase subunit PhnL|uniref:Phosphonate C-P lyase system protein PhnL n=1 Tax=Roseateles paludis TaxID=3145238 RepID=A0ABV0FVE5_9BURK